MAGLNETPKGERIHIAFLGRRNVGKSSLVNAFTGQELSIVSDVKGTTTDPVYKSMELLPFGPVMIIDTPGMREIGVCAIDDGIEDTFSDITELFSKCRFGNCRHDTEPDCAVKRALQTGELSEKRWRMYVRLHQENVRAKRMKAR